MRVGKLEIFGFRGIRHGEFKFHELTTLIGANNAGKTTITEALALVLGRDRLVRPLTEHDFHGSRPEALDRIKIVATLIGFNPNSSDNHPDWFRWGRAVIKWLDADTGDVKAESTKATDQLACQIAFAARFDHETLETLTCRYFYDADVDPFNEEAGIVSVPQDLIRQIGFFLVPASRTWDRTISFGSELFRRVVAYAGGRPAEAVLVERERLRNPAAPLEEDEHLAELVGEINADIRAIFGGSSDLKLRVTATDSDGILEAIIPHFQGTSPVALPSRRHGSGLISMQTLILLMRFGRLRVARGDGFMMVIEEPELHVPPPLQRKLVRLMQSMTTQTIITTHSSTVAAVPEPHQLSLIVNADGEATGRPLCPAPLLDAASPIRGLLLSDRDATVSALMHSAVLIPEGKTDARWLQLMVKALELRPDELPDEALSFAHEVGVIPTKDARVADVFKHLNVIHPALTCAVDGDQAGNDYIATCCGLPSPPAAIIRWPDGWAIENIIGWIVEADVGILASDDLQAAGVPQNAADFVTALSGPKKRDEILHGLIADAMTDSLPCRRRIGHLLRTLADISARRAPVEGSAAGVVHNNGATTVWTLNHAFQGI
jgi:putative ATP-dependent endonuclease of OLD family